MVALGYHGDSFHGSQTQPGIRTVEGSLVRALERLGWWTPNCLEMSSRTDAGVSVRMNLARINLPSEVAGPIQRSNLLRALNDNLPVGMVAWGAKAIPEDMRIRHSISRHYLYRTELSHDWPRELEEGAFIEACSCLQGQHDFTNLCRLDEGKNPVRTVDECIRRGPNNRHLREVKGIPLEPSPQNGKCNFRCGFGKEQHRRHPLGPRKARYPC